MANSIRFRTLSFQAFLASYNLEGDEPNPEGLPPNSDDWVFGEVQIPGHGWNACVIGLTGDPSQFWDEDDGWQPVPPCATFRLVSTRD